MRWIKRIAKGLGLLVLLLAVAGIAVYSTDPVYWKRVTSAPMGATWKTQWYDALAPVPGVERDDIPTAPPDTIRPDALDAARAFADQTESVSLLVWHRGALRYEHYGQGFGRATTTDSASTHKTVVALLVGAAIADGFIRSVDQPAADFLPEWTDRARKAIRIRDLLQMTSGLELVTGLNPFARSSIRLTLTTDIAPIVFGLPSVTPAGTDFQYANANPELLGIIIERAVGKPYAQYLSERLWSRLGAAPAQVQLDHPGGVARTFCCLVADARSWLRIGRLILDKGRVGDDQVIPAQWIEAMTTPSPRNPNYGYLTWLGSPPGTERKYNDATVKAFHSEPFAAPDVIFLDGFGGQRVYVVPSRDLIVVRMGRLQFEWDDAKLPNIVLRGLKDPKET